MGTQTTSQGAPGAPMNRAMRRALRHTKEPRRQREQFAPGHNPVHAAIDNATTLTQREREKIMVPLRMAFDALRRGVATYAEWGTVCSAITMAQAIEAKGVVKGLHEHLATAERACDAVWQRVTTDPDGEAWGRRTTLYFDEISALSEAIDLHDFQLQHLSVREIHAAKALAMRNVRAAGGLVVGAAAEIPQPTQEQLL